MELFPDNLVLENVGQSQDGRPVCASRTRAQRDSVNEITAMGASATQAKTEWLFTETEKLLVLESVFLLGTKTEREESRPAIRHAGTWGKRTYSLTSALDGGEWSAALWPRGRNPGTHWKVGGPNSPSGCRG